MNLKEHTFFDTDLFIFRLSIDKPVKNAAINEFNNSKPTAMSVFSMIELKGNYIQSLILMSKKIEKSDSFESAGARILNCGGRKVMMMFAQLISLIGGANFPADRWTVAQRILLTHIDAQIAASWVFFQQSVNMVVDHFNCVRASEPPKDNGGKWSAVIPECNENNSSCNINQFMMTHIDDLKQLVKDISSLDESSKTRELENIKRICEQTIKNNKFSIKKRACRKCTDLLIGLQSKSGLELLSSNYKEHNQLSNSLNYKFRKFPIAEIRSN